MATRFSEENYFRMVGRLNWNFTCEEINKPPSVVHPINPLTLSEERNLRKRCAQLIILVRDGLPLKLKEIYRSIILMHRFYMVKPFQEYDIRKVAIICLIEACKENPEIQLTKIVDVINKLIKGLNRKFIREDETNSNYESLVDLLGNGAKVDIPFEPDFQNDKTSIFFESCIVMCIFCAIHTTWYLTMDHPTLFLIQIHFLKKNADWNLLASLTNNAFLYNKISDSTDETVLDQFIQELLKIYEVECPHVAFFLKKLSRTFDIEQSLSNLSLAD